MGKFALALSLMLGLVSQAQRPRPTPYSGGPEYHVNNTGACADDATGGSQARPYCTLRYASTIAKPGDTFLVGSKRDPSGPAEFLRSGTVTAPITYRTTVGTVIGLFNDVRDEDFKPTAMANVYSLAVPSVWKVWQTFYDPILVDDPNNSRFTMVETDGPLPMSPAADDATLTAHEGTYRRDATTGTLYVHPYSNRVPSTTGTDLVVGLGSGITINSKVQHNVFDGFTVTYTGAVSSFQVQGSNNRFLNIKVYGHPWSVRGTANSLENVAISHVIVRGKTWLWHESGDGTPLAFIGANHRAKNLHLFHNWNSSVTAEAAPGLAVDGLHAHGAPNHCSVMTGANQTLRNAVFYNCQDYFYLSDTSNILIEHSVSPSGVSLQGLTKPVTGVTVRNSILSGTFVYTGASKPEFCQWEAASVLENSVISSAATIERCADGKSYPIKTYIANCESGAFTGCMTIRNVRYFTDWKAVLNGGQWASNTDAWDVTLAPGSPALNIGPSTTPTDILSIVRPQAQTSDAGIYEVEDKPKPVDCVVSEWSAWIPAGPSTYANWSQSRAETRARTIETPPANGGASCPELIERRTVTEPCTTITVNPQLQVTCNVAPPVYRKDK